MFRFRRPSTGSDQRFTRVTEVRSRNTIRRLRVLILVFALLGGLPAVSFAQSCLAIPGRGLSVEGALERAEKISTYAGRVTTPLPGGAWARSSYGLVSADTLFQAGHRFGATIGGELRKWGFSVCPSVGVEHTRNFEYEMVLDSLAVVLDMYESRTRRLDVPVGLSAGYTFRLPGGLSITPAGFIGRRWSVTRVDALEDQKIERQDWLRGSMLSIGWRSLYLSASRWPERIPDSTPENFFVLGFRPQW